jgi:hypothetical protein
MTVMKEFGVNFVIDSSKDICWLIDTHKWAMANHIRTINLLIWKNPFDLAYSYWKRNRNPADWRNEFIKCYSWIFEIGLPFCAINYNQIVYNPQEKIAEICAMVGMPYFEGKERFWEKKHHYLFGSSGIRRQVQAEYSKIETGRRFASKFKMENPHLQEEITNDIPLQRIIETLKRSDVSLLNRNDDVAQHFSRNKFLPPWYYRKRIMRLFRRYLPEPYDQTVK